tara:strand:- start:88 stop:810 length:723 start_codon:yes stop_codon:yes gene_type:complete
LDARLDQVVAVEGLLFRVKYSIVIPTLNEESTLISNLEFLLSLKDKLEAEIIVVDGQSCDKTKEIARSLTEKLYDVNPSRSLQLNEGIMHADGEYYIFLHVDTIITDEGINSISNINDGFRWGFFPVQLDQKSLGYSFLSFCINLRSRLFNYCTGDQVLVIKKSTFYEVNGFEEISLMEDIDISNRLKKIFDPEILDGHAITSARRWKKHGFLRTILLMRLLRLLFYLGVNTKILAKIYR